jgi:phospholipase/carboxylesterase
MSLKCLEIKNLQNPCNQILFLLHGYGADAKDLISLGHYLQRFLPNTYFVAPNAPVTCQVNPAGFEWFDLMQTNEKQIRSEFESSLDKLKLCIDSYLKKLNLNYQNLVLFGFSQGTMMSVQIGLSFDKPIKAILGYSGKVFDKDLLKSNLKSKCKIMFFHGLEDSVIPVEEMFDSIDFLKKINLDVKHKTYSNCAHSISPDGLSDGLKFLKEMNS